MKAIDRLYEFIQYKESNVSSFSKTIDVSNGYLSKQKKAGANLGSHIIEKIVINFPELNLYWLISGEGDMINKKARIETHSPEAINILQKEINLPLVNIAAVAGFGSQSFSIRNKDVKALYVIPKFKHKKIDFMIEIEGSSMYPKYNSGDVVACTIINESSFIQWNKTYVIATKEQGIIIKRIKKGSSSNSLMMVSDNNNFDPFEIQKNEIEGIALVVGLIRIE